jgi:stage III sporulation protein AB
MIRYVLFLGIFLSSTYLGFNLAQRYVKRYESLKVLEKSIVYMENQILYVNTPLPETFDEVSHKYTGEWRSFFSEIAKDLKENNVQDVYGAFLNSLKNYKEQLCFKDEDENILLDFSKSLGESGIFGQEKIFKLVLSNVREQINEAKDLKNKNCKMYRCLGMSLGAAIVIFLL